MLLPVLPQVHLSTTVLCVLCVQVNAQQVEMDTKFGAAHRAVVMLDKFEYSLPEDLRRQFNNAPVR